MQLLDYGLVMMLELVAGLFLFSIVFGLAYAKIRGYRQELARFIARVDAVHSSLTKTGQEFNSIQTASMNKLSNSELDHTLTVFSLHVARPATFKKTSARAVTATRTRRRRG